MTRYAELTHGDSGASLGPSGECSFIRRGPMQRLFTRTLTILALLLFPAMSLCPCGMIASTRKIGGSLLRTSEKGHCSQDRSGSTHHGRPESPCGSETCNHCPTDLVGVPYASTASSPTLNVLPVYGGFSSLLLPALSAARARFVAGDLPPPDLSRPLLELNCCLLI